MSHVSYTRAKLFPGLTLPGLITAGGIAGARAHGRDTVASLRAALRRRLAVTRSLFAQAMEFINTYSLVEGAALLASAAFASAFIAAGMGFSF